MTFKIKNREVTTTDILLSVISGLLGIILFFVAGVHKKANKLEDSFNKSEILRVEQYSELNGKLNGIGIWMELYTQIITKNTERLNEIEHSQ